MKNKIKRMKAGRLVTSIVLAALLCASLWVVRVSDVFAYNFVKGGAEETGTVTISVRPGANQANGYSTLGGYRVTYTITRGDWTAFSNLSGGYFLIGNDLDAGGGCQFAYHTSGGEIWQDGAVALGSLRDGSVVGRYDVESGTVSCSFDVNSLAEIPTYIAYAYEPASGAYIHINDEIGVNAHVWYYQNLKNASPIGNESIDTEAPDLTHSVIPTGTTADVGGKIWSTSARIQMRAEDGKSRPGGIRIYKGENLVHEQGNPGNDVVLETGYDVDENDSFHAYAYDKLNNATRRMNFNVSCIDKQAPDIHTFKLENEGYVKETRILADASDAGCGLHAAAYSWNSGAWTAQREFKVTENGVYTLKVRDALGNESRKTLTVSNIDRQAPDIHTFKLESTKYVKETRILADASDAGSGLHAAAYSWNDGAWTAQKEFKVTENGVYTLKVRDAVGNESRKTLTVSNIDKQGPDINTFKLESTKYVKETRILADASDAGSGLHAAAYSWNDGEWTNQKEFKVTENGVYTLKVRDVLGNESSKTLTVSNIDRQGPDIHTFKLEAIKYVRETRILADASDEGSGLDAMAYSWNGGEWTDQKEFRVMENGVYTLKVRDAIGNESSKTLTVSNIDRQAPDIHTLKLESAEYIKETRILAGASDEESGLDAMAYSWNGGAWTDQEEFMVSANDSYTLKVRDAVGNESSKTLTVSNIDREGPEITRTVKRTGKIVTREGITWSMGAEINVWAIDDKSGVSKIQILNGKGKTEAEIQNKEGKSKDELQLEKIKVKNGTYKIWTSDMLDNTSVTESFVVSNVDGEVPIIKELKTMPLEDGSILLTVAAEDRENGIGLDDEAYSFDGGKTWQKEPSRIIRENGIYEVLVRDGLHQETLEEKQITEVSIKEKPDPDKNEGDEGNKKDDTEDPDDQDTEDPGNQNTEDPGNQNTEDPGHNKDEGGNPNVPALENPGAPAGGNTAGGTTFGQSSQKTSGNGSKSKKTEKAAEPVLEKDSISKNGEKDTEITEKLVLPEKALRDAEEKVVSRISPEEEYEGNEGDVESDQMVRKAILGTLAGLFAAGCLGLILYLLLIYFRYSCVLYGIEDDQKKRRICRLPVKEREEEWHVEVPDNKLGLQGTGKYLLAFHPSFVKEEAPAFVIIQIDGKALREKLEEEIRINI